MEIDPDERSDDLYAVLNVSRDASPEEITKAYRKLAFVFHPDKHPAADLKDGAQEAFAKLQEAYEILGDERKRQIYDIYGKQVRQSARILNTEPEVGGGDLMGRRMGDD